MKLETSEDNVSAAKVIDLETRLAQAECTAAANLRNYNKLLEGAERERDEWQARCQQTERELASLKNGEGCLSLTRERDDAMAREKGILRRYETATAERDAALAKAEELSELKSRIEALADNEQHWGKFGVSDAAKSMQRWLIAELRALLQPAKPETALDVLARMQAGWGSGDDEYGDAEFTDDMAKLRKLLEAASTPAANP